MTAIGMRIALASLWVAASSLPGAAAEPFTTRDPLRAFVNAEYQRGEDYFIRGVRGTVLLRCTLTRPNAPYTGVAYSERSIWGNRGGPWELFRRRAAGQYEFAGTRWLSDLSCLQSCRSDDYLRNGRCHWQKGWGARHRGGKSE